MNTLTSDRVQSLLGISPATLYAWVRAGKLTPFRAGRALLFDEQDLLRLLGRIPTVKVWLQGGALAEAKDSVRRGTRTGTPPAYEIEYLMPPTPDWIRARVIAHDENPVSYPRTLDSLLEAMKRADFAFLGNEESVWTIDGAIVEKKGAEEYIAITLVRHREGEAVAGARSRENLELIRKGAWAAKVGSYRREDLYDRGPH